MAIYLGESTVLPIQNNQQGVSITKKISNYIFRFQDKIGQGNFSKVYKGFHQLTNEQVAIKIVELSSVKSAKLQELLFSEIQVIQSLNHPNILRCYQVLKSENNCYIITELCNGGDLQSLLKKQKCLNEMSAAPYIKEIFKGLIYLGERGIVHRDLKIANIFLHNGICKIADFGFAKYTNNQNFYDLDIGSPLYMSPEGMIDHMYGMKTDVWAFGIILFQLLHGKTPFSYCSTEYELKRAVVTPISYHTIRPDLSPEVRQLILKCLVVDYMQRPDALALKNDPFLYSLLSGGNKQVPHMKKTDSQLTHSMHASISVHAQQKNAEQYGKVEKIQSHSSHQISQSYHQPSINQQSYGNIPSSSAHFLSPQTNRPISGKYFQSPSQNQIQVPLEFNTNSPARVLTNFGNITKQLPAKDQNRQQQRGRLEFSPGRQTYQKSFDNIPVNNSYREEIMYPKYGNDRVLLPSEKKEKERVEEHSDRQSNSSWSHENLGKKKFPKTMSHENINNFQNNLGGMVNSQQKQKDTLNTSINVRTKSSFEPSNINFLQTPQKIHHSNSQQEVKATSQSFSGKPQVVTVQKLNFKEQGCKSPKKFGQLIKGQKKTDANANIKSVIKIDKVLESETNISIERAKTKSHLKFDQASIGNATDSGAIKTRSARHSIGDLSSCGNSEYMNQSVNQPPVRMPSFIQEKDKQKQELQRNLVCTIMQFKEAVGLLHYCRLYYRFVAMLKKTVLFSEVKKYDFLVKCFTDLDEHYEVYWRFLLTALSQLIENIRCKEIIYDGESYKKKKLKEDKLKEVTEEYFKKYMEEVNRNRTTQHRIVPMSLKSTSISFMKERHEQFWEILDKDFQKVVEISRQTTQIGENFIKNFRNLCYFGLRIYEANTIISNCIHMKNYKLLGDAMMQNWLAQEYYGQEVYLGLKKQHSKKVHDTNALKNSETNDTETQNHSRAKYL